MKNKLTTAKMQEMLNVDQVTFRNGVYTMRQEFFYTHGKSADKYVARVRKVFPNATILDSGEVWKPFRGSAPTHQSSHWFVKFKL